MTKRVLGILGSPRRGGNTEILLDEALRGAAEAGAETAKIALTDLQIGPCRGCDWCEGTHICIQEDDMVGLRRQMDASDVWVLGTPVYWWGPTAQFKTFLDRWYAGPKSLFQGRRIVLIIPLGDSDPQTARHTVGMFEDALDYVEAERFAVVVAPGVNARGEVRQHPDLLEAAYRAGQEAVTR
jgi:multimeric flavodoxin WrbA